MTGQPAVNLRSRAPIGLLMTGLLAVAVFWSAWRQHRLEAQIAELQLAVTTASSELHEGLARLEGQMPAGWVTRLSELEQQTLDAAEWPANAETAETYNDAVSQLVAELPASAEARYLSRLNSVRWAAMIFLTMSREFPVEAMELAAHSDNLSRLIADAPTGVSVELRRSAEEAVQRWSVKALELARAESLDRGRQVLDGNAELETMLTAFEDLQHYADGSESANEASQLLDQLRQRVLVKQAEQHAARLLDRWSTVQGLRTSDASLFEQATSALHSDVATARLNHLLEGVPQKSLEELDRELRAVIHELQLAASERDGQQQAKAVRQYQRWALEQVQALEKAFDSAKQQAEANTTLGGIAGASWTDAEYQSIRDSMVQCLLPINPSLLDPPVFERYQRAFQRVWEQLDGRDEQTFVAERCAVEIKKSLRDFMEDVP